MDDEATKILRLIIIVLFVCYALKLFFTRNSGTFRGQGYTIEWPAGWTDWDELNPDKKKKKRFAVADKTKPKATTYVTEDDVDYYTGAYAASMSITSLKLSTSAWIEDEMPKVMESLIEYGYKIIDKGEIKIDDELAKWVFYENKQDNALSFEFYIITEGNMFYKISFNTIKEKFNQYRPDFEKSKDSMKIKKGLF